MTHIKLKPNQKLFKEHHSIPYLFHTDDGWKIEPGVQEDGVSKCYTLYNPAGEVEDVANYDIYSLLRPKDKSWTPKFLTFYLRHGRDRTQAVKWSPAHFTPGTVVQTEGLPGTKDGTFTVKAVIQNGPSSFIIETFNLIEEGYFKGEPVTFNISYVKNIVSRPAGKVKISHSNYRSMTMHQCPMHGKGLITLDGLTAMVYAYAKETGYHVYNGGSIDHSKLLRRLKQMSLVHSENGYEFIIKHQAAFKFLKKNLHWAFCTIKEAEKIEQEYMDKAMDIQDDLDSDLDLDGLYGTETRDEMLA